ncbi:MAG: lysoplasmalogenase family protein [Clostridiales Family XIII bacterium]|jgi:hypothetical protein|nr:lysoplasmalogenase family protein [Clostridiales Family XIII bacterium]
MRTLYHRSRILFWLAIANAALYALFMAADALGARYPVGAAIGAPELAIPSDWLKYASICVCFALSLAVARRTPYKRDARRQVAALAFTLVADYLILFTPHFAAGIAVFCGAHLTAIDRYAGRAITKRMAVAAGAIAAMLIIIALIYTRINQATSEISGNQEDTYDIKSGLADGISQYAVPIAAVVYAILITAVTIAAFKRRQARANNILSRLGMILFLLCDVNVLLWNMRTMAGFTEIPAWTVKIIWMFYLPGQTMLALSAYDFDADRTPCCPTHETKIA